MAKSFKELGRKAEELIEQGHEADENVQRCQASVAAAGSRVAAARRQLDAASMTDEDGNPVGDVEHARAQLIMAENYLEASQRALSSAQEEVVRIRQQKSAHAQEIEQHNRVERSNLQKLRRLKSSAFAENSAELSEGIAQRLNEAEDIRVALLRSMGVEATADHVSEGGGSAVDPGWKGGGFAALDTSGQARRYQGGGSDGTASGGTASGGGTGTSGAAGVTDVADAAAPTVGQGAPEASSAAQGTGADSSNAGIRDVSSIMSDASLSPEEKADALHKRSRDLEAMRQHDANVNKAGDLKRIAQTLQLSDEKKYKMGTEFVDTKMEIFRYELRKRGVSDADAAIWCIPDMRAGYFNALSEDIRNGTVAMYDLPDPDFDAVAAWVRSQKAPGTSPYAISDQQRAAIREGIRNGTITEQDIRSIGHNIRGIEKYERFVSEKNRELEEIRKEQFSLTQEYYRAGSEAERNKLEFRRRALMQRENDMKAKHADMMKSILSQYREVGIKPDMVSQPYKRKTDDNLFGASHTVRAIEKTREYFPSDWMRKSSEKPIAPLSVKRGYYKWKNDYDIIALNSNEFQTQRCAFHEMGHRMERMYPEILTLEKQFYDRRTKGESLSWLGEPYPKSELTRFDHFINPYMGKDYGGSAYELVSMGMESVYYGSFNISRDPEYEDLILGILAAV